jgi:hypothetical protein
MSPLISTNQIISALKAEMEGIESPLVRMALDSQLNILRARRNREQTMVTLGRDNAIRQRNEQERAAVKCGLRNAKENPGFLPEEGWHLKGESAKKLQPEHRLARFFRKFLGVEVPIPLLKKLTSISAGKPSVLLKTLDLEFLSVIPDSRRFENADKLLAMIAAKVN